MRRALRVFALVATAATLLACALGVQAWRASQQALAQAAASTSEAAVADGGSALETIHGVAGHLAALACFAVAAASFLLGLHGLLESGGRHARALVLFLLGPAVMGVALWAELTGLRRGRDELAATIAGPDMEPLLRAHALPGAALLGATLLAVAGSWLLAQPDRPGADDEA